MLGFLARTAARTAVRAAVRSHMDSQRQAAAQAAMPFAVHPRGDGESALFQHRHVGFAHLLPAYPQLGAPTTSPIEHSHDALVALYGVPVCVRYHVSRPNVPAADAQDFATRVAHYYIGQRARSAPQIKPGHGALLHAWAAEAAVLARYDLAQPDPWGADHEELALLVRAGHAMAVTYRYARAEVHWVTRAFFATAANAAMSWDGARL